MGGCLSCIHALCNTGDSHSGSNQVSTVHSSGERTRSQSASAPVATAAPTADNPAKVFTFLELVTATRHFRPQNLLGEGGFGPVYRGRLESTGQVVAVKRLDRRGPQGNREFLVEVLMLCLVRHPNLVTLIGYCAEGDQRLLVYEYMPLGSLDNHLYDLPVGREPLDWNTRMKIASGIAKGLEYLHNTPDPPIIFRDFKSANILLDEDYSPKLSDFGLAKLGPVGDQTHVSTRIMGTYGYCAPEYVMTGHLTPMCDVYSFGVVLLELITGRKAYDNTRPREEQSLVRWARPLFRDRKKFQTMADPLLKERFPRRGLHHALAVAAMCLQDNPALRPLMGDVVSGLALLGAQEYEAGGESSSGTVGPSTPRGNRDDHGGRIGLGSEETRLDDGERQESQIARVTEETPSNREEN